MQEVLEQGEACGGGLEVPGTWENKVCGRGLECKCVGHCATGDISDAPYTCVPVTTHEGIGGGVDDHGCIGSAGYQYCTSTERCYRSWEEACPDPVMCTQDVKLCPDGSYVGRSGPHCNFACPGQLIACTAEARICPDGSAVGRSGPNCEFSPCPSELPGIICTEDAMECPDGSTVGRSGPNCEFVCPSALGLSTVSWSLIIVGGVLVGILIGVLVTMLCVRRRRRMRFQAPKSHQQTVVAVGAPSQLGGYSVDVEPRETAQPQSTGSRAPAYYQQL